VAFFVRDLNTKMLKERRRARRVSTDLAARWNTPTLSHEGKIIDLSTGGCFILTASQISVNKIPRVEQASEKEALSIEVQLSRECRLKLRAEVVYRVERVGFAARFLDLTLDEEQALRAFVERHEPRERNPLPFPRIERGRRR
jgi:PilZ domain